MNECELEKVLSDADEGLASLAQSLITLSAAVTMQTMKIVTLEKELSKRIEELEKRADETPYMSPIVPVVL